MTLDIILQTILAAIPTTKRSAGVAAVAIVLLLTGCSALNSKPVEQATQVLDVACATGLLQSTALQQQAQQLGVPPEVLSDWLCRVPDVADALAKERQARSVDPGRAALTTARARGLL